MTLCKDCKAEHEAYKAWCDAPDSDVWWDKPAPKVPPATVRPAPHPGPRCATHHRAKVKRDRNASHARRLKSVYSIDAETYSDLYELQGGTCAICRRATGATRRLSVDHDHKCCDSRNSCGTCVRGLLCRPCNDILGHLRDDPVIARRIVTYLQYPPLWCKDKGLPWPPPLTGYSDGFMDWQVMNGKGRMPGVQEGSDGN